MVYLKGNRKIATFLKAESVKIYTELAHYPQPLCCETVELLRQNDAVYIKALFATANHLLISLELLDDKNAHPIGHASTCKLVAALKRIKQSYCGVRVTYMR